MTISLERLVQKSRCIAPMERTRRVLCKITHALCI
jgi:hypothetical protein